MVLLNRSDQVTRTGLGTKACVAQIVTKILLYLLIVGVWYEAGLAADANTPDQAVETRIEV
jgi:hypothetical protein